MMAARIFLGGATCLAVFACTRDGAPPTAPNGSAALSLTSVPCTAWSGSAGEDEAEVFGRILVSSSDSSKAWLATLDDLPGGGGGGPGYADRIQDVNFGTCTGSDSSGHKNAGEPWGWYGIGPVFGDQCFADSSSNDPERHRPRGASFPPHAERHCLKAGELVLRLMTAQGPTVETVLVRPVDFAPYPYVVSGRRVESLAWRSHQGSELADFDVIIDHSTGTGASLSPTIAVTAAIDASDTAWSPLQLRSGAYRFPRNFVLRVDAAGTSGIASTDLVRYFWRYGVDSTDRTGFANPTADGLAPLVRVHQYPDTGAYTVRAHVVRPWQRPSNIHDLVSTAYGATVDLNLQVYDSLTAVAAASPAPVTIVGNGIQVSISGSNGAGGNRYCFELAASQQCQTAPNTWGQDPDTVVTSGSPASFYVRAFKADSNGIIVRDSIRVWFGTLDIVGLYGNPTNFDVKGKQYCTWQAHADSLPLDSLVWETHFGGAWSSAGLGSWMEAWTGLPIVPLDSVRVTAHFSPTGSEARQVHINVISTGQVCP